jgi:hypothetical protein
MSSGPGEAAGRLALVATTGLALGVLVGGVLGRLAMFLLVRASPEADGVVSDDGFEMGRFTLSGSLNLIVVAAVLGTLGAAIYAAVRWFQLPGLGWRVAATSVCAGLGVGAMLVHRDGVDFTVLRAGPAIALFVAVPALYGALLTLVVESFLRRHPDGFTSPWARALGLLPFAVVPVLPAFLLAWLVGRSVRGSRVEMLVRSAGLRWAARAAASGALALLARDLALDIAALT